MSRILFILFVVVMLLFFLAYRFRGVQKTLSIALFTVAATFLLLLIAALADWI